MAAQIPVVGGSISYTSPSYSYGQTSQAINGGYTFDLPLATVAAFTNTALTFSAQNTQNAQGFFSGVLSQQQSALTNVNNQSFQFQDKSLMALQEMHRGTLDVQKYAIKKRFSIANLLKPGSGCFITTAVCRASGKPDNCTLLQFLRKFRDEQLLTTKEGAALVEIYYQVAPAIVEAIDKRADSASIYNYLLCNYIDLATSQISVGDFDKATQTYASMVSAAAKFAGIDTLPVTVASVDCTCKGGKRAAKFHAKTCPKRNAE